ncbi:LysR substrate-binding domain-containing protein [Ensifer sp. SSB1]|uniref:LysR substrate-binding domain-containing protein n=1 Tax=Ensifer sp. SSB1 TaxID=2795385 RepID=UPI001A5381ED|nr:LysR substrate-binding domain-containing protein [Ensifer sp. SSB1]MBK5571618.1 LysR family transcriptional regulator [Ensifer sp. SSB1]
MSKLRYMLPSSQSLFVFEAAARNLNFKLAAAELNVTQPSISHAIKALERHCKVDLFVRDNRGVQLTEAGRLLYDSVRSSFQRIEQSLKTITSNDTHYITVAASTSLAAHWLVPKLSTFQQRHPGIKIKIVTTDRDVEPDHQVDMTIWVRQRRFERPNSWYMCDEIVFPVCSPAYLASKPSMHSVDDLAGHRLIHSFDPHRKRMGWSEWLGMLNSASSVIEPDVVFNDYQLAIQAALAGEGVALGWALTTDLLRRDKLLVRPLAVELRTQSAFFLIANERSSKSAAMQLLVEWVVEEAQAS